MNSRPPLTPALIEFIRVLEWMGPSTMRQLVIETKQSPVTVGEKLRILRMQGWISAEPHRRAPHINIYQSLRGEKND